MAINLPNPGILASQAGSLFVSFRNDYQAVVNLNAYIASIGGAAALQNPPFSFSSTDANALVAALGNIVNANLSELINGTEPFWGGQ